VRIKVTLEVLETDSREYVERLEIHHFEYISGLASHSEFLDKEHRSLSFELNATHAAGAVVGIGTWVSLVKI
jgi:hypothetical protein